MVPRALVVGASAGGPSALRDLLGRLDPAFPAPVIVVVHVADGGADLLAAHLRDASALPVRVAEERDTAAPGTVYLAPGGYHLLMEADGRFALSGEEKVLYSRPAIDVLFASAADAFGRALAGLVLTGASRDGAEGLKKIRDRGGLALVQDPRSAEVPIMPQAALEVSGADICGDVPALARALNELFRS